jgi:GTP-binding protein HflX
LPLLRVILADVIPKNIPKPDAEKHFAELVRLIETLGGYTVVKVIQRRGKPSSKTYLGSGKAVEVGETAQELKCDIVVVNGILKGNQYFELSERIKKPIQILDRVDVILRIFEKHAKTAEAKLQIKRAQLAYEIPKIYRRSATTLFERERGGGVIQRGAGETGIEAEKRHLKEHIRRIDRQIEQMQKIRGSQRRNRKRQGFLTVALVGYTNSGKSTLLKALTSKRGVYIADELFATLDSRIGSLWLPKLQKKILLADTIGFIENLPPDLIAAFRATLEEVSEADLLLHVFDASDNRSEISRKKMVVNEILAQLECKQPQLYIANKMDIAKKTIPRKSIGVSAVTGKNLEGLVIAIEAELVKAPLS